ncbi:MAG: hypothetical protein ACI9SJ_000548 [Flavobacteriaceae bacterium]|jgi:hypothetical protein
MNVEKEDFPLSISLSYKKLFDLYRIHLESDNVLLVTRAKQVLTVAKEYPILESGIPDLKEMEKLLPQIDFIMEDLFSSILGNNEIKAASFPFQDSFFKSTQRYKNIIKTAGEDFDLELMNFSDDEYYIMGCSIILGTHYGYNIDFRRPFYYKIPDANGILRSYRVLYNADFIEIEKTKNSIDITKEDVDVLLESFDDISKWKEKFPPESWNFKGFVILNMFDVTLDTSISDFKTSLITHNDRKDVNFNNELEETFRSLFNLKDLKIGFSNYIEDEESLERIPLKNMESYIINDEESMHFSNALCNRSYAALFKKHEFYCVSNVGKYHRLYPDNPLYKQLNNKGIQSAIICAMVNDDKVLGLFEIVSPNINDLNTINANKLKDIMPFLVDSVVRRKREADNEVELIIQEECTSIHNSVHWKFKLEAKRYLKELIHSNTPTFQEVVFEDVYPLFGQMDIKGSSVARNNAVKKDLTLQLNFIKDILIRIQKIESLPIYDHIEYRINDFLNQIDQTLLVDSERQVVIFIEKEILPLFKHLSKKSENLKETIGNFCSLTDSKSGFTYKFRKLYDDTVTMINKNMAGLLDTKQVEAQQMYPHYYERFKTDGVEHNLYIGESITKDESFNEIYLYNLRLWQLQVMCEMENEFYQLKNELPVLLDVASMILAFNNPLSLRFRMDEKRFDVDGAYNASYEVVKKRIDKSCIKGTTERITQPGKISIIYSHKDDEFEYLKYVGFLQSKKQLDIDVEVLDIEDLQGVTGLKAIRVSVLYSKKDDTSSKEYYTYEDLMNEIEDSSLS